MKKPTEDHKNEWSLWRSAIYIDKYIFWYYTSIFMRRFWPFHHFHIFIFSENRPIFQFVPVGPIFTVWLQILLHHPQISLSTIQCFTNFFPSLFSVVSGLCFVSPVRDSSKSYSSFHFAPSPDFLSVSFHSLSFISHRVQAFHFDFITDWFLFHSINCQPSEKPLGSRVRLSYSSVTHHVTCLMFKPLSWIDW